MLLKTYMFFAYRRPGIVHGALHVSNNPFLLDGPACFLIHPALINNTWAVGWRYLFNRGPFLSLERCHLAYGPKLILPPTNYLLCAWAGGLFSMCMCSMAPLVQTLSVN